MTHTSTPSQIGEPFYSPKGWLCFFWVGGWWWFLVQNRRMRTRSTSCCAWRCMVKWKRFQFTPLISCKDIPRAPVPRSETKVSPATPVGWPPGHTIFSGAMLVLGSEIRFFHDFFTSHLTASQDFWHKSIIRFFWQFFLLQIPYPKTNSKSPRKVSHHGFKGANRWFSGRNDLELPSGFDQHILVKY